MKMYKEKGISPFASCLPTLIQFPVIIGLYQSIIQTMGNAPLQLLNLVTKLTPTLSQFFSFLPGLKTPIELLPLNSQFLWMDLGKPDLIQVPFLPFGIPILAIIVVVTTYMQSKLLTPPSTTSGDQGAAMGKAMNLYMPFLMGYLALTLASGLSLYFVVSNVIGIAQYAALGKVDIKNLLPFRKPNSLPAGKTTAAKPRGEKKV